jgi:integral membrane protein (TIGR01906 family)
VTTVTGRLASLLTAIAVALVIVAVSILPFLTPQWVAFEQGRAQATAWTGFTTEEIAGTPVLNQREQAHMADVRTVFRGLWILALASIVVLLGASRRRDRARTWRAVRGGALGLTVGTIVLSIVGLVAFDQLFSVFHEIFFPAGSYLFDPATDRLVQLFPFQFWDETTMVVGAVIIAVSLIVAFVAGRRASRTTVAARAADLAAVPEPGS